LGVHKKIRGEFPPNAPRVGGPGQIRRPKVFHWGPSYFCWGLDIQQIYI